MAGNGICDAAVLAEADVGIAMRTSSDVAIESDDVISVNGDLRFMQYRESGSIERSDRA